MKALSLFSGAGGDTLGLERAGYQVIAFSEFKAPAILTHQAAFPGSSLLVDPPTKSTDITKIPDTVFQPFKGEIDLVFAGFPCQGFSHAGKKRPEDPRNELVHQFVRVVKIVQPRWIIGENVRGLLSRKGIDPTTKQCRPVIEIIRDLFLAIGYRITYRIINAATVGVPQLRNRILIVGTRDPAAWPHLPWETIGQGIAPAGIRSLLDTHLEGAIEYPSARNPAAVDPAFWILTTQTAPTGVPHPNLIRLVSGIRNVSSKEKTDGAQGTVTEAGGLISFGSRKSAYHGEVVHPDRPSKTIICTYGLCPRLFVGLHNPQTGKYWVRCLSVQELGQIQGFPKDYPWKGTEKEKITQIGNAVPPALATSAVRLLSRCRMETTPQTATATDPLEEDEEEET